MHAKQRIRIGWFIQYALGGDGISGGWSGIRILSAVDEDTSDDQVIMVITHMCAHTHLLFPNFEHQSKGVQCGFEFCWVCMVRRPDFSAKIGVCIQLHRSVTAACKTDWVAQTTVFRPRGDVQTQTEPSAAMNESVRTGCKQHQKNCPQMCVLTSSVDWASSRKPSEPVVVDGNVQET